MEKNIDLFAWDEEQTKLAEEKLPGAEGVMPPAKEEEEEIPPVDPKKEKEETPVSLFDLHDEQNTDEEVKDFNKDKPADPLPVSSVKNTLSVLKEKGFFNIPLEEGRTIEDLSEAEAEAFIEDKWEENVDNTIKGLLSELPPVVQTLNKIALKGGDINEYLQNLAKGSQSPIKKGMDLASEENQITVARISLREEGYDEDYINSQVEFLKDSDRLKMFSQKKYATWEETNNKKEAALLERTTIQNDKEKQLRRELKNTYGEILKENKSLGGITISREDAVALPAYISDRTTKDSEGRQMTGMQKDLFAILKDPKKTALLAVLIKSGFDFSSISKKEKSAVSKEIREDIRRVSNTVPAGKEGGSKTAIKSLAEYFD